MSKAKTILLAEDNPADAELTLFSLKRLAGQVHVDVAADGVEVLNHLGIGPDNKAAAELPSLILLDLKMPKVDGIGVLKRLKEEESTRMLPVVIMTSSNEEKDVIESYRLGVNSYIVKPVQFEAFIETVSSIGLYWVLTNRAPSAP